ncbi:hypothetical protein [Clavibacter nebraskensis]|uniref:hypothetical protein n=1 Tax=Clavibacter nebraskensis TaxID=31963 RepID=UPI003F4BBE12
MRVFAVAICLLIISLLLRKKASDGMPIKDDPQSALDDVRDKPDDVSKRSVYVLMVIVLAIGVAGIALWGATDGLYAATAVSLIGYSLTQAVVLFIRRNPGTPTAISDLLVPPVIGLPALQALVMGWLGTPVTAAPSIEDIVILSVGTVLAGVLVVVGVMPTAQRSVKKIKIRWVREYLDDPARQARLRADRNN